LGEAAPLFGTDKAPVPPGAAGEWFEGAGGARLRAALFPTEGAPRGTVILSGGRTEAIEKYFEVAAELTSRGFVVVAHDWRGQGLSQRLLPDRLKGHADNYLDFVTDYDRLLDAFAERMPQPWLAVSHSMGGCLTARALAHGQSRLTGAVFSAPMFAIYPRPLPRGWIGPVASGLVVALGGATAFTSGVHPAAAFEDNQLTHDPGRYARNVGIVTQHPDLALGPPTWGWLNFAFKAMAELHTGPRVPTIQIPVVVVAAGADHIVDSEGVRRVTERMPNGRYLEAPGAFHEVLQETDEIRAHFWRAFDETADRLAPRA
jgi:lysophospholipase